MHRRHLTLLLLLTAAAAACSGPEDDVRRSVEAFEAAALWRDPQALYNLHVDSQGQGVLCDARFTALFDKARAEHSPATCRAAAQLIALPDPKSAGVDEDDLLLSELLAFQCANPTATCPAFARDRFERSAQRSPFFTRPLRAVTPQRVLLTSPTQATAYVEATFDDAPAPERLTLYLTLHDKKWLFTTYPW